MANKGPGNEKGKADGKESGAAVFRVYEALRVPIMDGQIPPGERINIDAVARKLGVSQTPVREALQRLEGDDLLVYTPGRGYRTTPQLDLAGLRSVFEFRLLVEPWAARTASADRLSNPASALDAELAAFEAVAKGADVRQELLGHDTRFHNLILAATGNDVVANAYTQSHCHLHVFRLYSVDTDGAITITEHRRIAEAIRDCKPEEAAQAMADHIRKSYARSAEAFERDGKDLRLEAGAGTRVIQAH